MATFRDAYGRLDPAILRLVLITDGRSDLDRLERIVGAVTTAGVRCVQVREPRWTARTLVAACERLRPLLDAVNGALLVNDRVDVAAAGVAHGVQLGHRSLPVDLARRVLGDEPVLAFSAHDAGELELAAVARCDFATLSPVWPTSSKPGAANLGESLAAALTADARLPVVWLGGIAASEAARVADYRSGTGPAGVAVRSALMAAEEPRYAATALLRSLRGDRGQANA
ncbi:MAG: thiamine phosphate synthase [bacterium]|nr:thiamine phosphate synthase [bacterium]